MLIKRVVPIQVHDVFYAVILPEDSAQLMPKPAIWHDTEPLYSTYHPCILFLWDIKYYHVYQWLKTGFGLLIGFIDHLQVVTTTNYNTVNWFSHYKELHANLFSLSPLAFNDL
jgi:hypothetical protein